MVANFAIADGEEDPVRKFAILFVVISGCTDERVGLTDEAPPESEVSTPEEDVEIPTCVPGRVEQCPCPALDPVRTCSQRCAGDGTWEQCDWDEVVQVDPCDDVQCDDNTYCLQGQCVECLEDFHCVDELEAAPMCGVDPNTGRDYVTFLPQDSYCFRGICNHGRTDCPFGCIDGTANIKAHCADPSSCEHECDRVGDEMCVDSNRVRCESTEQWCRFLNVLEECEFGCSDEELPARCLEPIEDECQTDRDCLQNLDVTCEGGDTRVLRRGTGRCVDGSCGEDVISISCEEGCESDDLMRRCDAAHDWDGDGFSELEGDCSSNDATVHPGDDSAFACISCGRNDDPPCPDGLTQEYCLEGGGAAGRAYSGRCEILPGEDVGYCAIGYFPGRCDECVDGNPTACLGSVRSFNLFWSDDVIYTQSEDNAVRHLHEEQGLPDWIEDIRFRVTCYTIGRERIDVERYDFRPNEGEERHRIQIHRRYDSDVIAFCLAGMVMNNGDGDRIQGVLYGEMQYEIIGSQQRHDAVHGILVPSNRHYFIDLTDDHRLAPERLPPLIDE